MTVKIGACRTCDAPVYWLRSDSTGKLAPVDLEPVEHGNVTVDLEAGTYGVGDPGPDLFGNPKHLNHWVTCPSPPQQKGARR